MNISGQIHVTMRKAECYGGRRIHLHVEGLPGWLMSILAEAGSFRIEASSYNQEQDGPYSLLLGSERVVTVTEPAPRVLTQAEPPANEEPTELPGDGQMKP